MNEERDLLTCLEEANDQVYGSLKEIETFWNIFYDDISPENALNLIDCLQEYLMAESKLTTLYDVIDLLSEEIKEEDINETY